MLVVSANADVCNVHCLVVARQRTFVPWSALIESILAKFFFHISVVFESYFQSQSAVMDRDRLWYLKRFQI